MICDKLWKAQRKREKEEKEYGQVISEAKRQGNRDREDALIAEWLHVKEGYDNQISSIDTGQVQAEAEKYRIPTPPLSDKAAWDQGYGPTGLIVFLNAKARLELRNSIRQERRARWEDRTVWIDRLILPLIAFLSAATAFVAVWKK